MKPASKAESKWRSEWWEIKNYLTHTRKTLAFLKAQLSRARRKQARKESVDAATRD